MKLTEQAIRVAAIELFLRDEPGSWDTLRPCEQDDYLRDAAIILEAALPHVQVVVPSVRYDEESTDGYSGYVTEVKYGEYIKYDDCIDAIKAAGLTPVDCKGNTL